MRLLLFVAILPLAACSAMSGAQTGQVEAAVGAVPSPGPAAIAGTQKAGAFTGVWRDCGTGDPPDVCSYYVLLQRDDRICGTWSYVATYDGYEGRVIARASSPTHARRTRVCGRPGSEARTECEDGWDRIDKPMRLCDGRLVDIETKTGTCEVGFERVPRAAELDALAMQPWVQACLAGTGPEAGP